MRALFLLLSQMPEESARFQLFVKGRWGHSGGQQDEATFVLCQKSMGLLGFLTLDVIEIGTQAPNKAASAF